MNSADTWMELAACRGHDPELWFDKFQYAEAIAVCDGCPVRRECRDFADAVERTLTGCHGIWAGLAPGQRRDARRRRAVAS